MKVINYINAGNQADNQKSKILKVNNKDVENLQKLGFVDHQIF